MHYDAVIFDLDGTLLNTLDDLADSANHALEHCGFPPADGGRGAQLRGQRSCPADSTGPSPKGDGAGGRGGLSGGVPAVLSDPYALQDRALSRGAGAAGRPEGGGLCRGGGVQQV